jgi:hypothetical protein
MKLIVPLCAFLIYSTAFAQEINGRLYIAKKIMAIYQEHCRTESEENKQAFELAASYIIHGEYNDMKEQMLKARSDSKNADCHKSIDNFLN